MSAGGVRNQIVTGRHRLIPGIPRRILFLAPFLWLSWGWEESRRKTRLQTRICTRESPENLPRGRTFLRLRHPMDRAIDLHGRCSGPRDRSRKLIGINWGTPGCLFGFAVSWRFKTVHDGKGSGPLPFFPWLGCDRAVCRFSMVRATAYRIFMFVCFWGRRPKKK